MNIDRTKLEKLFDEHFIDEPSSEVFDAMNEIIDYAEKAVKLFAIPSVSNNEVAVCCETCANFISTTKLCNKTCIEYSKWRKAN